MESRIKAQLAALSEQGNIPAGIQIDELSPCIMTKVDPSQFPDQPVVSLLLRLRGEPEDPRDWPALGFNSSEAPTGKGPDDVAAFIGRLAKCRKVAKLELVVMLSGAAAQVQASTWAWQSWATDGFVVPLLDTQEREAHSLNRLASVARGSLLIALRADRPGVGDLARSTTDCAWLQRVITLYHRIPQLGAMVHGRYTFSHPASPGSLIMLGHVPGGGGPHHNNMFFKEAMTSVPFQYVLYGDYMPLSFRAVALEEVGGFDEDLPQGDEPCSSILRRDLFLRLWKSGWRVGAHDIGLLSTPQVNMLPAKSSDATRCSAEVAALAEKLFEARHGPLPAEVAAAAGGGQPVEAPLTLLMQRVKELNLRKLQPMEPDVLASCPMLQPEAVDKLVLQLGIEAPGVADAALLDTQLYELQCKLDQLQAEELQESLAEKEQEARQSRMAAEIVQEQERRRARATQHDAAFARRLASVDENEWEAKGDYLEEPFGVPPPPELPGPGAGSGAAGAAAGAGATGAACASGSAATQAAAAGPSGSGQNRPAGGSSASAAANYGTECLSCFERFPADQVLCAGSDAPSSSTAPAGCGHYFCAACMTQYVRGAVKDRKFPVTCPMGTGRCKSGLSREAILALLHDTPEDVQAFQRTEAASALDPAHTIYCPHKACSSPMMRPDDLPPDQPSACPACRRAFCARCLVPGWHKGYTCAAFQALPPHLRSAEDAAMLQYSAQQKWKQCPQCRLTVERSEGCNHRLCRCGRNFCYACGKRYQDTKPTAANVHGTPGCECQLFTVPDDEERNRNGNGGNGNGNDGRAAPPRIVEEVMELNPVALGWLWGVALDSDYSDDDVPYHGNAGRAADNVAAPNGVVVDVEPPQIRGPGGNAAQGPWRGGRPVRRRRCRHSASIQDCPYGGKCWYWHDEDGAL
ncbi:hypothetical protein GPECTOR_40g510 [Gonium pectorale]|uniref:RBR-type E3 ubiquitin transferase n=1 Tax=Gonium pectorale TaxID=33097 RepID=A0A150GAA2_GONPE|nr:hypothetical protein GPECTOR_40g510 [Gonium pectorale]|eukprot:KXZ46776.1 hypothetical protein GPECTOR_40g510 [Gonium pectorale]